MDIITTIFSTKLFNVEAVRGNIYDTNGILLATSLPHYNVAIDLHVEAMTDEIFRDNVDSLAYQLSTLRDAKSEKEYKRMLEKARANPRNRYISLKKHVSYTELQLIKKIASTNLVDLFQVSDLLKLNELKNSIVDHILLNFGTITKEEVWKELTKSYPSISLEIMAKKLKIPIN